MADKTEETNINTVVPKVEQETFSYSKIDTYNQCGFKYKLNYVDGNYLFNASIATEFGTLIHATEEAIALAIKENREINYIKLKNDFILKMCELEHKYPKDWANIDKSNRTYKEKEYEYLDSSIYNLEQFMKEHPTYEIVGIEQAFKILYKDNRYFKGFIDRVFYDREADKYIIQDIKTYPVPMDDEKLVKPLQFVIYTLAAKELYNCEESQISCEYYLPLCNLTQSVLNNKYISEGLSELAKLFNGIDAKEFKPKATALCHWCQYNPLVNAGLLQPENQKAICPYASTWAKKGDRVYERIINWKEAGFEELDVEQCVSLLKNYKGGE